MLPRLYAILDASCFPDDAALFAYARELASAGVTLVQYRNKQGSARQMLSHARELRRVFTSPAILIMNDRADLCLAADCDGVHLGQDDLSAEGARSLLGLKRWIGISAHNVEQVRAADQTGADYIAIGPVFSTSSKANPDPLVGLEGVQAARQHTRKPLVAIGGIKRENCRDVIQAGADSVAIIADLLKDPRRAAQEYLKILSQV